MVLGTTPESRKAMRRRHVPMVRSAVEVVDAFSVEIIRGASSLSMLIGVGNPIGRLRVATFPDIVDDRCSEIRRADHGEAVDVVRVIVMLSVLRVTVLNVVSDENAAERVCNHIHLAPRRIAEFLRFLYGWKEIRGDRGIVDRETSVPRNVNHSEMSFQCTPQVPPDGATGKDAKRRVV